jgi:membrane-bound metal-dependent hydrolase YbcI (DUF457 family)/transcriptional regulator with XRE-family HTH domain
MMLNEIAAVIVALRASRGWSQTDLATRAGVSRNCIALIESRSARANNTIATLESIFAAFDLTLDFVVRPRKKSEKPADLKKQYNLVTRQLADTAANNAENEVNGPTHLLGGLAAGTLVALLVPAPHAAIAGHVIPPEVIKVAGCVLAGAAGLAPDRIQYTIKSARFPLEGHRGCSHTLLFAIVTALLFRSELAAYWFAGLLSHLALDVITIAGVPLFWPLHARRVALSWTKNGSAAEAVLRALLTVFIALTWLSPIFSTLRL